MTTTPETLEVLKNIIKKANVAMLITVSSDNRIVARPMQLQDVEFDGDIWFLTTSDTDKCEEIKMNIRKKMTLRRMKKNHYLAF